MSQPTPESVLQRLDWTVVRRLDGLLQGDHRTLFYGHGLDLADIREYQPQDDVRYIDWNVTARLDTPYVRQYHEDRDITAQFVCDLSPSIDFGTQGTTKRALAVEVVAVLSRLLVRRGNRVGAILFDGVRDRPVPAGRGRLQVLRLLHELALVRRQDRAPLTALGEVLGRAGQSLRRRSLVFVVSDFFSAPGWEGPLARLAQRHDVIAVRVRDRREHDLPDIGWVVMTDAETGEQLNVDTHDTAFRARFQAAVSRHEEELRRVFARTGVDLLDLETDGDLVRQLLAFAHRRKLRGRQGGVATAGAGVPGSRSDPPAMN